jgi:hypothetical protein
VGGAEAVEGEWRLGYTKGAAARPAGDGLSNPPLLVLLVLLLVAVGEEIVVTVDTTATS